MCCEHKLVDIQSAKWCLTCGTAFEDKVLNDCTENEGKHNLVDIKQGQWCARCGAVFIGKKMNDPLINQAISVLDQDAAKCEDVGGICNEGKMET